MKEEHQSIKKVTTTNLDIALRMCNIEINKSIIDEIIDLVELIEIAGDDVTIKDVCKLQADWIESSRLINKLNNSDHDKQR